MPGKAGFSLWSFAHITALLLCLGLILALCRLYIRAKNTLRFRRALAGLIFSCELLRLAHLALYGQLTVYQLPLHLCGLAVFFTLFHALRGSEGLWNFLYSCCMPGAVCALLFPDWTACPAFSFVSLLAFFVHSLLAAYPLLQLVSREMRPKPRHLPRCALALLLLSAPVYAFDRRFGANYMFLLSPAPGSPLELFARLLGEPGYLLGYVPMIGAVWTALYLPFVKRPPHKKYLSS